ncbi:MAG: hypothetical protein PUJ70_06060, partial [Treponema sp.]|nr:hypothetical protein [Treponema sp.]MDY5837500.1 hypothetical protein [Treponema sp.]
DPLSRTKEVILTFDEKHSEINAGMFAQIKLYTVDYSDKIVLPVNSVFIHPEFKAGLRTAADILRGCMPHRGIECPPGFLLSSVSVRKHFHSGKSP